MGDRVGTSKAGQTRDWKEVWRKIPKVECRLFIRNLPFTVSIEDIRAKFVQFGALTDVFIPKFPSSGRSKGFAFITFKRWEDAMVAIELLNGQFLGCRRMMVSAAINRPANRPPEDVGGSRVIKPNVQAPLKLYPPPIPPLL
ncbi:glycine-rich RNA-binding protein 1-like [Magnolia sinica]|uniref:glycine-rich RNA-binding protein 1-like n=1 Tax=Magnolia sinica TaxID=86752 RepID=UPI00265A7329|nr:glycine-rich RNA-binding protein 1-like [Magnolia sinica]